MFRRKIDRDALDRLAVNDWLSIDPVADVASPQLRRQLLIPCASDGLPWPCVNEFVFNWQRRWRIIDTVSQCPCPVASMTESADKSSLNYRYKIMSLIVNVAGFNVAVLPRRQVPTLPVRNRVQKATVVLIPFASDGHTWPCVNDYSRPPRPRRQ